MSKCLTVVISAFFLTSKGHSEDITTIFQTNGTMGHCSKSKLHHWDWAKVLLYRWPRLMSSVCASLMFAASREQTASHRVLSNEDDNSTWKHGGLQICKSQSFGHRLVYCSFYSREKLKASIFEASQQYVFNFSRLTFLQNLPRTCKYKSALTS